MKSTFKFVLELDEKEVEDLYKLIKNRFEYNYLSIVNTDNTKGIGFLINNIEDCIRIMRQNTMRENFVYSFNRNDFDLFKTFIGRMRPSYIEKCNLNDRSFPHRLYDCLILNRGVDEVFK